MDTDFGTAFQVVQKIGTELATDVAVVDDEVDFEVLFETTYVHVGSTHGRYQSVHDDYFAVVESFTILKYSNPGFQ
mgnify:FL=1